MLQSTVGFCSQDIFHTYCTHLHTSTLKRIHTEEHYEESNGKQSVTFLSRHSGLLVVPERPWIQFGPLDYVSTQKKAQLHSVTASQFLGFSTRGTKTQNVQQSGVELNDLPPWRPEAGCQLPAFGLDFCGFSKDNYSSLSQTFSGKFTSRSCLLSQD